MLDHISIGVCDLERAIAFYDRVLAPLGYRRVMTLEVAAAYGAGDRPVFWIDRCEAGEVTAKGFHVAFAAPSRAAVDGFFAAAMAAGARDDGKPGLRSDYHADYYAAFVFDRDGHRIEAVCHRPESSGA